MRVTLKNEFKKVGAAIKQVAPANAVLCGMIAYKNGTEKRIYSDKRGATEALEALGNVSSVSKCLITEYGLHNQPQLFVLWQLVNDGQIDDLLKNENLFLEV